MSVQALTNRMQWWNVNVGNGQATVGLQDMNQKKGDSTSKQIELQLLLIRDGKCVLHFAEQRNKQTTRFNLSCWQTEVIIPTWGTT